MKCVYIMNPKSGNGKILKYKKLIYSSLKKRYDEVEILETKSIGHAKTLAKEYGDKVDALFFSGGDGTLNEIVNGIMQNEKRPIIGQIPSGTVNDFSKSLGIKKNIKKSLKQILSDDAKIKEIDIFKLNEEYGVYICGFGVFTKTSYDTPQAEKKRMGWLAYVFHGLREMNIYKTQQINFKIGEEVYSERAVLALIMNSKSVGGFKFNKSAKLDDGMADFILFKSKGKKLGFTDLVRLAKLFVFGVKSISKSKRVMVRKISEISVNSETTLNLNFDGEFGGGFNQFNYTIQPKAIKILVPKKTKAFL